MVGNVSIGESPFLASLDAADGDGNGRLDVFDVLLLQGYLVGTVPGLPIS